MIETPIAPPAQQTRAGRSRFPRRTFGTTTREETVSGYDGLAAPAGRGRPQGPGERDSLGRQRRTRLRRPASHANQQEHSTRARRARRSVARWQSTRHSSPALRPPLTAAGRWWRIIGPWGVRVRVPPDLPPRARTRDVEARSSADRAPDLSSPHPCPWHPPRADGGGSSLIRRPRVRVPPGFPSLAGAGSQDRSFVGP